jgi:hypothetical protein
MGEVSVVDVAPEGSTFPVLDLPPIDATGVREAAVASIESVPWKEEDRDQ